MNWLFSIHWALVASIWYFANGMLHDLFVLFQHKGKYDRELLRLLMDGHVLILSGILLFVCWLMMLKGIYWSGWISIIVAFFMLIYCAMIFPFLKSIGTIVVSMILLIVSIIVLRKFPG